MIYLNVISNQILIIKQSDFNCNNFILFFLIPWEHAIKWLMECHNDFKVDVCHIEVHADKYVTACMNSRHHSEINGGAFVNVLTFVNYIICVILVK